MEPPNADLVYQGICTLFHNNNPKEQEKANKWLEEFQKSVSLHNYLFVSHIGIYIFVLRYTLGQLPMNCCNKNEIYTPAILLHKPCATKFKIVSMSFQQRHMIR